MPASQIFQGVIPQMRRARGGRRATKRSRTPRLSGQREREEALAGAAASQIFRVWSHDAESRRLPSGTRRSRTPSVSGRRA